MTTRLNDDLAEILTSVLADPNPLDAFNEVVLGRVDHSRVMHDGTHPGAHWWAQRQICSAMMDPEIDTVCVVGGHSIGKSFVLADVVLGWPCLHPDGLCVSTSPSNTQLSGVLWKEVRKARNRSPLLRNVGRITQLPNRFKLSDGWESIGYATNQAERLQGWHSPGPLCVLVDEASGIQDPETWATLESMKPTKKLLSGNPLWDRGMFYETARRADDGDRTVKKIWIPSTFSPDIGQQRSERGLADAKFLANMDAQYGVGSQTWNVRVGALFPEGTADRLIPGDWLDACERAEHQPHGPRRMHIDLGLGNGGDDTCFVVRDDNGIVHWEASNTMSLDQAGVRAATLCHDFGVQPYRVSWDVEGLGSGFHSQLRQNGLVGCLPYRGQTKSKSPEFNNLRTACHVLFRRRLDPSYRDTLATVKPTFFIPRDFMVRLRKELREVTHSPGLKGQTVLRTKEDIKAALRFSPDYVDTLAGTFAFPYT
jgi:hypothetical protein